MEENNDKKPFLETGNDGKVFWSSEKDRQENKTVNEGLGAVECGQCLQPKPFERVRWDSQKLKYICFDCQEQA